MFSIKYNFFYPIKISNFNIIMKDLFYIKKFCQFEYTV